jgi:hypothetical protein
VSQFVYTAYLPSLGKSVKLTELKFTAFKQLCKLITNDNDTLITDAFDGLIKDHCIDDVSNITFLDKLIILLTIRAMCMQPSLELTVTHPENGSAVNLTFKIYDIIEKIDSMDLYNKFNNTVVEYGKLKITYGIPAQFYFKSNNESIFSTIRQLSIGGKDYTENILDIIDQLPAAVYKDAKQHLYKIQEEISKLSLLSVNFSNQKDQIQVTPNLLTKSTLDFLKLCFKRDLTSLYEIEYFLLKELHLSYDLISQSTLAELLLYINLYKEEQANKEKAEKRQTSGNPLAVPANIGAPA